MKICDIVCYGILCINLEKPMLPRILASVMAYVAHTFMVAVCYLEDYIHMSSYFWLWINIWVTYSEWKWLKHKCQAVPLICLSAEIKVSAQGSETITGYS